MISNLLPSLFTHIILRQDSSSRTFEGPLGGPQGVKHVLLHVACLLPQRPWIPRLPQESPTVSGESNDTCAAISGLPSKNSMSRLATWCEMGLASTFLVMRSHVVNTWYLSQRQLLSREGLLEPEYVNVNVAHLGYALTLNNTHRGRCVHHNATIQHRICKVLRKRHSAQQLTSSAHNCVQSRLRTARCN